MYCSSVTCSPHVTALPESVGGLASLTHLDLRANRLTALPSSLAELPLLAIALAAARGNQIRAAQLLGLNRNTLRKKIRDLGIEVIRGLKAQ